MEANNHVNEASTKNFNNWYCLPAFSENFNLIYIFWKILIWKRSHRVSECGWAYQRVDVTSGNIFVICNVYYFDFLVSSMYAFNILPLSSKWVRPWLQQPTRTWRVLSPTKIPSWQFQRSPRGDLLFFFRLNIALYH